MRRACGVGLAVALALSACSRGKSDDLWDVSASKTPPTATADDPTGVWEGEVSMGGIRMRIERERLTLALQCDPHGDKRSQATAPIAFETAPESRMVLRDALAGGDKDCGFRFNAGDAIAYRPVGAGGLEVAFAGASVARLVRIADLPKGD